MMVTLIYSGGYQFWIDREWEQRCKRCGSETLPYAYIDDIDAKGEESQLLQRVQQGLDYLMTLPLGGNGQAEGTNTHTPKHPKRLCNYCKAGHKHPPPFRRRQH